MKALINIVKSIDISLYENLLECDGATPGNTLGMGNPAVPTAEEPGSEPIISTHPRNKKKIKKKNLKESILDDFDTLDKSIDLADAAKDEIYRFLNDNYSGRFTISNKMDKQGLYVVNSYGKISVRPQVRSKLTNLTNGLFRFGNAESFSCYNCPKLKSLEGAPEVVYGSFMLSYCNSIESLEGAPKEVGGSFYCAFNPKLTSLDGAPTYVGKTFDCKKCGKQFTENEVKQICKVYKEIIV
jgi:hypothetical protein